MYRGASFVTRVPRSQQAKRKREIYQLRRTTFRRLKSTNRDARRPPSPISRRYLIRTRWPVSLNRRYALLVTVPRPFLLVYTAKRLEIIFTRVILIFAFVLDRLSPARPIYSQNKFRFRGKIYSFISYREYVIRIIFKLQKLFSAPKKIKGWRRLRRKKREKNVLSAGIK